MNRGIVSACLVSVATVVLGFMTPACGGNDAAEEEEPIPFGLESEVVTPAGNVDAMEFAPDGRLFFAEHWSGDIKIVTADAQLLPEPFATMPDMVPANVAWGLTGLALDPDFETNRYVYALYTQLLSEGPPVKVKPVVVRFTDSNNTGSDMTEIVGDLPEINPDKPFNTSGSLHFGPDGYLYLTLGDYDQPAELGPNGKPLQQDLGSPIGKMLRVNKEDGSAAPDNPFVDDPTADPRIYAYGLRGAANFTFHPQTGRLYATDSSGPNCEGAFVVEAGDNLGWPDLRGNDCSVNQAKLPIGHLTQKGLRNLDFGSSVGATGIEFISGDVYPVLGDSLVYCQSASQQLRRLVLASPNLDSITADDALSRDCWLDVTVGPDGLVYYANLTEIRRLKSPTPSPTPPSS